MKKRAEERALIEKARREAYAKQLEEIARDAEARQKAIKQENMEIAKRMGLLKPKTRGDKGNPSVMPKYDRDAKIKEFDAAYKHMT